MNKAEAKDMAFAVGVELGEQHRDDYRALKDNDLIQQSISMIGKPQTSIEFAKGYYTGLGTDDIQRGRAVSVIVLTQEFDEKGY